MKHALILTAFVLLRGVSIAQQPIGLNELTKKALGEHPRLVSARTEIDTARANRFALLAPFRPQISLNAYGATGSGSMIFSGAIDPTNYALLPTGATGVLNGTFMWRLYSFGRDRDLALSGTAAIRSSEASFASEALDVALGVRTAFADALFKRETTEAHHAAYESALEVLRVTQARFDAGKVPEAFVFRAKADAAAAEREIAMTEADEAGSIAALWEAAGMEQLGGKELGVWDATISAPASVTDALKFAMLHRPELVAISEEQKQMKALVSAADRSRLPELSLMGMNDWSGSSGNTGASTYKAGLVLSFPLGDGGQRHAEIQQASAGVSKAGAGLRASRNRIQSEVVSAWAQWQAVSKIAGAAKAELDASDEAYRIALLRYQEGKAILAELTDARSGLTHAKLSVAEATAYQRKAWSKLDRAIGRVPTP